MRRTAVALATCAVVGLGACGAATPERNDVRGGAQAFESAVRHANGAAACARLAPATVSEIEQSSGSGCDRAILSMGLRGGEVTSVAVYGLQAQVILTGDTVFMSRFDDGWRVTAAGCTPQTDKPFDCLVKGS